MKTSLRGLLRSPKAIFFISLTLYFLCQCADLHVAASGASPWQQAVSGLFFNIVFPVLLYWRLLRVAHPFLRDPRMLPAMHCVAGLFGTIQLHTFSDTLVGFSRPWPVLWLVLFTAAQLMTLAVLFLLCRRFLRIARAR
ncbi:hypothetical protein [Pantoea sp. PNA 03-3]|uniref:hypothetical protein n=1 Tax=Pantoea sp. PNA 03-3 TaxID=2135460 RepID=UPI000D75A9A3|nr:hypothetical protein [Pantoea sp. PNA 03-3]PXV70918.1 hypothetical protein C7433_11460 [Pantoea sp. PNA 03-3]